MKILVTGSKGFLGTYLSKELTARGHEVWGADQGHGVSKRYSRCDFRSFRQVERLLDGGFDFVYHLAAEFGRHNGEDYYENLWGTNAIGNKHMIRLQERLGFRCVYMSSSEVYGDWSGVMAEDVMDTEEIKQLNDYAISKWVGEMQVLNSASEFSTESVRIRPFNLYGVGEMPSPYRSALARFVYYALTDEPYTVYSNHTRSWLYGDDAAVAMANIIDNWTPGEAFNIGSAERTTMKELSDIILEMCQKSDSLVTYEDEEPMTTHTKVVDLSKAEKILGLATTIRLADGLARTIDWTRGILSE